MKKSIYILVLLITPLLLSGQQEHRALSMRRADSLKQAYIDIATGLSYYNYRDFSTSPLSYHGVAGNISVFRLVQNKHRDSRQGFYFSAGPSVNLAESSSSVANLLRLDIVHTELYRILHNPGSKWNFMIGGMINLSGNIRRNESLMNNSFGTEAVGTLFASAKITYDISRKKLKEYEFFILNFKLIPRKRELSLQINPAIVNATYRNGYNYSDHSQILNEYNYFERHKLRFFNGYRLNSALEYKIYLNNKNAVRLGYYWDAYFTGENSEKLEMASHKFLFSFLININEPVKSEL